MAFGNTVQQVFRPVLELPLRFFGRRMSRRVAKPGLSQDSRTGGKEWWCGSDWRYHRSLCSKGSHQVMDGCGGGGGTTGVVLHPFDLHKQACPSRLTLRLLLTVLDLTMISSVLK